MQNRPDAQHGSPAHETRDANIHTLIYWGIALAFLLFSGFAVGYITFRFFTSQENVGQPPTVFQTRRTLPPEPRLQVNAPQDLRQYYENEQKILNSYGWVSKSTGVVQIPIDRAMDLLIQKGLPYRGQAETKRAEGRRAASRALLARGKGTLEQSHDVP